MANGKSSGKAKSSNQSQARQDFMKRINTPAPDHKAAQKSASAKAKANGASSGHQRER